MKWNCDRTCARKTELHVIGDVRECVGLCLGDATVRGGLMVPCCRSALPLHVEIVARNCQVGICESSIEEEGSVRGARGARVGFGLMYMPRLNCQPIVMLEDEAF